MVQALLIGWNMTCCGKSNLIPLKTLTQKIGDMKYKLTDETKEWRGHILHRIECIDAFSNVCAGEKGGWIESESNLSQ